jgi:hypothetical protein
MEEEFEMMENNSFDMTLSMDGFEDIPGGNDEHDDFDPFRIGEVVVQSASPTRKQNDKYSKNQNNNTPHIIPLEETTTTTTRPNSGSHSDGIIHPAVPNSLPPQTTIGTAVADNMSVVSTKSAHSMKSTTSTATIPPKMLVKLKIHEEVSSESSLLLGNEGRSDVFVVGTVMVSSNEDTQDAL